ncbi:UDP-2,4-diacetamido-2,4,6-trideoxy-beta-L-altropyranose hydrolase [Sphingopyxis terrae]|uniref:UDP-2,4-diacetamido-2,4, 6-trideoxy-beta-L-altropyranose hydrolase n=1 Tax=Sphingopyxis terrae TaxID=33052 RepID=UPI002A135666|nr:UDP-2,4-diacetamido-2,4,6-trideoxy-beta-L-altropyranose hydrolase [Sphingopyxis terrae]MDX8357909.1 UDP-2,4-diacetamido-2,4,6-trideoxy-beta-L-altropyranose hydrolase [Sphingopyxis terrae]
MTILFRTDASTEIGTGHVMRCLTLADALAAEGASAHFLCRAHPGHLAALIERRGHGVTLLARGEGDPVESRLAHSAWLGSSVAADVAEALEAADSFRPEWVVVDHYALDVEWETAMRRTGARILAIDDLADRAHDCDVLLDQNLGRSVHDYARLVPVDAAVLAGPAHALLRDQFVAARASSLLRRQDGAVRTVLVNLGGVDRDDATSVVLSALAAANGAASFHVRVVLGASALWGERVRALAATLPFEVQVMQGIDDMAVEMASADIAIGAAGSTSWERCALGLPTVMLVLADNQRAIAAALDAAGCAINLGDPFVAAFPAILARTVADLASDANRVIAMSGKAAATVDGEGCARVVAAMMDGRAAK